MSYPFPSEFQAWIFLISFAVILFGYWGVSVYWNKNNPKDDDDKKNKKKKK